MKLDDLVKPDSVLCNVSARSKKHCLEILSELLTRSNPDIGNEEVFAALIDRERLGCTCLDRGIAFPHCRINGLKSGCGALMKLADPVDFDSPDGQSVDLVFGLMVPEELDADDRDGIVELTRLLRDEGLVARLRAAKTSDDLSTSLLLAPTRSTPGTGKAQQG